MLSSFITKEVTKSPSPLERVGVRLRGISKRYGKVAALQDVSLDIERGEIFGIIGPDGAGKTTLMRILTTLLLPDGGKAQVDGLDVVKDMKLLRRRVGYMPGKFSLYQDLSVEENLKFFASIFGTTVSEGYELIAPIYSQIEPFKDRRAGALSGGMKQKLALSCALVHKPSVLFLDEPTTGVDPVSRKELWAMLKSLKKLGITIIASTPYIDEIRLCDRIAFFNHGEVKGVGTPDAILNRFAEIFLPKAPKRKAVPTNILQRGKLPPLGELEGAPSISVSHLVKSFGSFRAVDDISFSVSRGEIFGFLGANGAGKTTAMRILTGLSQPTSGKAIVAGFDVSKDYEQVKRHIGYMSQRFSLYNDLTVSENIRLFAGIYGMKGSEIRVKTREMLERLNFSDHAGDIVGSLPLGWKQKLAFSVSIFHEPEIVFLDEPTGGVDPATRRQFWQLIYNTAQRGITIFVTTHYMDEATYCDRISIMVDGKISAMGKPSELCREYGQKDMDSLFTYLARKGKRQ